MFSASLAHCIQMCKAVARLVGVGELLNVMSLEPRRWSRCRDNLPGAEGLGLRMRDIPWLD